MSIYSSPFKFCRRCDFTHPRSCTTGTLPWLFQSRLASFLKGKEYKQCGYFKVHSSMHQPYRASPTEILRVHNDHKLLYCDK